MNEHALERLEYPQVMEILASYATSGLGKREVGQLHPLSDRGEVERLLAETTELKVLLMPEQDLPIGGLHDVSFSLLKLEQGADILPIDEILAVGDTLRAARNVRNYIAGAGESYPHVVAMADNIGVFDELEQRIEKTFNEGGGMRSSASPRLKNLRNEIQTLRGRVRGKLSALMRSDIASHLQDTSIREIDQRPALAVRASALSKVRGMQRGRSDSGNTVFVEPEGVREMSDELARAMDKEKEEIRRILQELAAAIADRLQDLRTTLASMAHVDMTFAKVRMSRAMAMQPAVLNGDGVIRLREARHPLLLDLAQRGGLEEVVPIDVRVGDDFHTLIITGPNTGGKTVALKTIGLLTLMCMTGMHVPAAAESSLPVLNNVFADIGDEQSIEQSLSTFSSHLTQIGQILREADGNCLVLMDELGGGTDPAEGGALAKAILEFLHERQVRTAVTTHISQLKMLAYSVEGMENASIEFDVETLKPTHKVMIGTPGSSNALSLARRLGLPEEVIARAEDNPQDEGTAELLNALQAAGVRALAAGERAQEAREKGERLASELQRKLEDATAHEQALKVSNGQAAYATLRKLLRDMEALRTEEPSKRALLMELGNMAGEIAAELDRAPEVKAERKLRVGGRVHVRSLGRVGVLVEMDEKAGRAVVDFGALPLKVALEEVEVA
ncbi:MAG: DNA mismatch repair protein MutS2 [Candidatus Latescibacterota bacterium]